MRSERLVTKLPCGGKIRLGFYEVPSALDVNKVAVVCLPEIYCTKSYAKVERCAWLERLRKVYSRMPAQYEGCGDGDKDATVVKAEVEYGDGIRRHVRYGDSCGLVICGRNIFQDRQLRVTMFYEPCDPFKECNNVKAKHGNIIAFFGRLFGRKTRREGK